MGEFLQSIQEQLIWATGGAWFEYLAVVCGVAYVILAAARNIWCWPMGFISSAIYVVIMWDLRLYMDTLLFVYYVVMAVYGFWMWKWGGVKNDTAQQELPVAVWSWKTHLLWAVGLSVGASANGYFLAHNTNAAFPYWDSYTTWFALFATFLVTRKVLENWIYWVVLDLIWAVIYFKKGIPATSGLMIFYTGFAIYGFSNWLKRWKAERAEIGHSGGCGESPLVQ